MLALEQELDLRVLLLLDYLDAAEIDELILGIIWHELLSVLTWQFYKSILLQLGQDSVYGFFDDLTLREAWVAFDIPA